jgi:hypothetical protein
MGTGESRQGTRPNQSDKDPEAEEEVIRGICG